jgi:parallel beta-helix repeat protein
MKRIGIGAFMFLAIAVIFYNCKKSNIAESVGETGLQHKTSGLSLATITDDTQSLQTLINAGSVTLTAGKTYHVTGLNVTHSINMNGATIILTNTVTYTFALTVTAPGVSITNGTISGPWSNTTAGNANGYGGVYILANSCTVSHVNISAFSAYGIVVGACNSTKVTYCNISNTGYIGFFYDAETVSTSGGVFSNNTVDRSMVPAATLQQMAIGIRGSLTKPSVTTTGWTITNNIIKLPLNTVDMSAEGMELRYCNNAYVANNTITGGSIGISVVTCTGNVLSANTCSNVVQEGIEYADCTLCKSYNNVVTGSANVGELIDGSVGCNGIQISGDKVSGTAQECIHAYYKTQNLTISGCNLTSSVKGTYAINLQNSNYVTIQSTKMYGSGLGLAAVILDNCPGNLTLTNCTVSNFTMSVVYIYNSTKGLVTNNVTMTGAVVSGVPQALTSVLDNGGLLGSNISVHF